MKLIDLSHVIENGMTTYPGLPGPEISAHMTFEASASQYAEGTEFSIGMMRLVANTGTYLDTPAHRYRGGDDLSALPLERCALLPGTVVDGGPEFGTSFPRTVPLHCGPAGRARNGDFPGAGVCRPRVTSGCRHGDRHTVVTRSIPRLVKLPRTIEPSEPARKCRRVVIP